MTITTRQARTIRNAIHDARSQRLSSKYMLISTRMDLWGRAFNHTAHQIREKHNRALEARGPAGEWAVERAQLPTWSDLTAASVEGYRARVAEEQTPYLVAKGRMTAELADLVEAHLTPSQTHRLTFIEGAIRSYANKIDELDAEVDAYRERITR